VKVSTVRYTKLGKRVGGHSKSRLLNPRRRRIAQRRLASAVRAELEQFTVVLALFSEPIEETYYDDCPRGREVFDAMAAGRWHGRESQCGVDDPYSEELPSSLDRASCLAQLPDAACHDELDDLRQLHRDYGAPTAWRSRSISLLFAQ
jgi:hypothetical protein